MGRSIPIGSASPAMLQGEKLEIDPKWLFAKIAEECFTATRNTSLLDIRSSRLSPYMQKRLLRSRLIVVLYPFSRGV